MFQDPQKDFILKIAPKSNWFSKKKKQLSLINTLFYRSHYCHQQIRFSLQISKYLCWRDVITDRFNSQIIWNGQFKSDIWRSHILLNFSNWIKLKMLSNARSHSKAHWKNKQLWAMTLPSDNSTTQGKGTLWYLAYTIRQVVIIQVDDLWFSAVSWWAQLRATKYIHICRKFISWR